MKGISRPGAAHSLGKVAHPDETGQDPQHDHLLSSEQIQVPLRTVFSSQVRDICPGIQGKTMWIHKARYCQVEYHNSIPKSNLEPWGTSSGRGGAGGRLLEWVSDFLLIVGEIKVVWVLDAKSPFVKSEADVLTDFGSIREPSPSVVPRSHPFPRTRMTCLILVQPVPPLCGDLYSPDCHRSSLQG